MWKFLMLFFLISLFGCESSPTKLPFYINHNRDRYGEFALIDEEGFEIIGKGFSFESGGFVIEEILNYGFNDTSIIVNCKDSSSIEHHLASFLTSYINSSGHETISFCEIPESEYKLRKSKYSWVKIK